MQIKCHLRRSEEIAKCNRIISLTRLNSKSNVREKRGVGDGGVRLMSLAKTVRRRMPINEENNEREKWI